MSEATVYIYALIDPNTNEPRYIGSSVFPKMRLRRHITERTHLIRRSKRNARKLWTSRLYDNGQRPKMVLIDKCPESRRGEVEDAWISRYQQDGHNLFNVRKAGDKTY